MCSSDLAVNWGRYAELFDFDASRRRFILPEDLNAEIEEAAQAAAAEDPGDTTKPGATED